MRALERDEAGRVDDRHVPSDEDDDAGRLADGVERVHRASARRRRRAARRSRRRMTPSGQVRELVARRWCRARTRELVSSAMRRMKRSAASTTPTPTADDHVEDDREQEAREQHEDVAPRRDAERVPEVAHLAHVPRDERAAARRATPSARTRRAARATRIASSTTSECTTGGDRRARAGADVRRRARERAGRGDAAEERRDDVADAERRRARRSGRASCPVMPSAMTAERSDSIAPSIAIANARATSSRIESSDETAASPHGKRGSGGSGGMPATSSAADDRVEAAADRRDGERRDDARDERVRPTPRHDGDERRGDCAWSCAGTSRQERERRRGDARARATTPSRARPRARRASRRSASGSFAIGEPEDVLDLERRDDRRDAGGEPGGDRVGDELDEPAEARDPIADEHDARPSAPR